MSTGTENIDDGITYSRYTLLKGSIYWQRDNTSHLSQDRHPINNGLGLGQYIQWE